MKKFIIHTDGGSRGNPGPSALGVVIKNSSGELIVEFGEFLGVQTNNYAEYMALVRALEESLAYGGSDLLVKMDSELIVKQMTGTYKIKQPGLIVLATRVKKLLQQFSSYKFEHVRREFNKEADSMVNQCLDSHKN